MIIVKTVLVTGASRGIGKAAAIGFGRLGYNVAVNYCNNRKAAEETAAAVNSYGGRAAVYKADISESCEVSDMVSGIEKELGGVDILVNNAGIAEQIVFSDITEEKWDRMFDVNVKGAYLVTKAVLPHMIHEKHGRIINISSMWGVSGGSCEVHYSAAKAAVIGMTKALAKELGPSGITVNCVAPGVIDTDMNMHLNAEDKQMLCDETPLMKIGTPEDVAAAVLFFASDGAGFVTGQILSADGGITV